MGVDFRRKKRSHFPRGGERERNERAAESKRYCIFSSPWCQDIAFLSSPSWNAIQCTRNVLKRNIVGHDKERGIFISAFSRSSDWKQNFFSFPLTSHQIIPPPSLWHQMQNGLLFSMALEIHEMLQRKEVDEGFYFLLRTWRALKPRVNQRTRISYSFPPQKTSLKSPGQQQQRFSNWGDLSIVDNFCCHCDPLPLPFMLSGQGVGERACFYSIQRLKRGERGMRKRAHTFFLPYSPSFLH